MTNREAIEMVELIKKHSLIRMVENPEVSEALNLAIQALEKQQSKLVKCISFTYDGSVGNCPDCNSFVDDRNNSIICKCGQKLLWKEVQDEN